MSDRPVRRRRPQTVLEVVRREQLTPTMVRLYLGGENFPAFTDNEFTDRYVKIFCRLCTSLDGCVTTADGWPISSRIPRGMPAGSASTSSSPVATPS